MKIVGITEFRDNVKMLTDTYDIVLIQKNKVSKGVYFNTPKDMTFDQADKISKILGITNS